MKTYANNEKCIVVANEILHESEKAYLCLFAANGESENVWLPKSQVDCAADVGDKDVEIGMDFWLCEKKHLEDFIAD